MSKQCPVCSNSDVHLIRQDVKAGVPPHMQKNKDNIIANGRAQLNLLRCNECTLDFLEIWNDPKKVYEFYDNNHYVCEPNVTPGYLKYDERKRRLKRVLPHINKRVRLLDIGCGNGYFLQDIRPYVAQAEGMEVTRSHIDKLRGEGFTIHDTLLDNFFPETPYDVIVMHATLEHVANVDKFVLDLKRILNKNGQIFIEVPNMRDPLANTYDIESYRKFFYRQYHLYYFSEISLSKLFQKVGFQSTVWPELMVSMTNHFHWMYMQKGQPNTNAMVNVALPCHLLNPTAPNGAEILSLWNDVDDYYRKKMEQAGIGDMLIGHFNC